MDWLQLTEEIVTGLPAELQVVIGLVNAVQEQVSASQANGHGVGSAQSHLNAVKQSLMNDPEIVDAVKNAG